MNRAWIGTYPTPGHAAGSGEGIWLVEAAPDGRSRWSARQVAEAPAPSFLAASPDGAAIYAVGETSPGVVLRYTAAPDGSLVEGERVTSGGSEPCHLLVHPSGRALYVAQYGSGSLAMLNTVRDGGSWHFAGGLGQVFEHSGLGPHERQEGPHVHSSVLLDDALLALDLGTDELRRYRVAPDGVLTVDEVAGRLPHGSGPRHAARLASGRLLVVAELTGELYLLAWDANRAAVEPLDRVPLCDPPGLPSHLTVHSTSAQGPVERVVVGVRGPDELVVVDVVGDRLQIRDRVSTVAVPRHHAVVGDVLLVAGQGADRVAVHPIVDAAPAQLSAEIPIPAPACILPVS